MSTLQVANIWFESTANNRIQYVSPDSYAFVVNGTNTFVVNSTSIVTNAAIVANGGAGTPGQVLTSNGTGIYWSTATGGGGGSGSVTQVATGNGLTGGPISYSGTISVRAGTGIVSNAGGVYVNAAYIATLPANNALYLDGTPASGYITTAGLSAAVATLTANNTAYVGDSPAAQVANSTTLAANLSYYQTRVGLAANVAALGYMTNAGSYTISGVHTHNANIALTGALLLGGSAGLAGQVLTSNGTSNVYWASAGGSSNLLDGQPGSYYTNASNMSTGTLPYARLGTNVVNTTSAFTFSTVHTHNANIALTGTLLLNSSNGQVGQVLTSNGTSNAYWSTLVDIQPFTVALSNETDDITTGTAKVTVRAPFAMTLTSVPRASVSTASTSGKPTVDIKVEGSSILSTILSIDANEKTSVTAATPAALSTTAVADDAEITFDVTVAGTGAKGLKVTLYFKRA